MNSSSDKLINTGERIIEDDYKASSSSFLIYLFHIATYNFCQRFVNNKKVLEFGCGSGYGTHLISPDCESIVGVDISEEAVNFARHHYKNDKLEYLRIENIESSALPFDDCEFDTVISFQVMEHVAQVDKYLKEIRRVLRDDGVLIIATPDRTSRLFPRQRPWNVYHVTEYSPADFLTTMADHFSDIELFGMSARQDVVNIELKRTRFMRITAYLFTFPGCPDWYRRTILHTIKWIGRLIAPIYRKKQKGVSTPVDYGFSVDDIVIEKDIHPSVNILCVARKTPQ